ncbi:MAG: hypothetical protein A4S09_12505 [Proteobacteria bacterium SG_bin7]|nr:MAG: hypothetical protein A4S09_12505 [Proteobacteria bacterium SG_bin7]
MKSKKVDPFKTRKTKSESSDASDTISPPIEVAEAIDQFRECQDQAKHFEGEATIHKNTILSYAENEYVKRLLNGRDKSFKVLGEETMVTYVVMDSSAGLTEEDVEEFTKNYGEEAAEDLITRDYGSIKFDAKVLEENYGAVVDALQVLPEEVLSNLFKPMLMKARPGAAEKSKKYAKKPDDLLEILRSLRIKNYIR